MTTVPALDWTSLVPFAAGQPIALEIRRFVFTIKGDGRITELGDGTVGIHMHVPPQLGNVAPRAGVYVARVIPESPAAETGLQPGDILTAIDGTPIVDAIDLTNREAAIAPGTKVHLEGIRRNTPFSADLTLVQRPPPRTTGA